MKQNLFFCDHCQITKYDSEIQSLVDISFSCSTLQHWKKHLQTKKHILNCSINENLSDEVVTKCKHCNTNFTKEQYKSHHSNNSLLWAMKTKDNIYKDCSCNNFVFEGKRFANLQTLKSFAEKSSKYEKRKKYDAKIKAEALKLLENEEIKEQLFIQKRQNAKDKLRKQIEEKNKKNEDNETSKDLKEEHNIKIEISTDEDTEEEEEEEEEESLVQKAQRERKDFNIPPIIDPDDLCEECGYTRNEYLQYPEEKLKRYGYSLCSCEETDYSTDED